ncbi:STAS domain-containing protein [Streptomyces sp. NPDC087440]|uniref:STAS domain-containing protein n=1 Tax=Streptomyces sp. NPDC087440 TaxID=3365790 RepID=UPI00381FE9A8
MEQSTSPNDEHAARRTDRGASGTDGSVPSPAPVPVVTATGDLDWDNSEDFAERLQRATSGDDPLVIVELATVTFADSSVLHALLTAHRTLEKRGGRLAIAGPLSPSVFRLFEISRADGYLNLVDDVEAARRLS